MSSDFKEEETRTDSTEPVSAPLTDTGRSSMQGALEQARVEQAQLEQEMQRDARALDEKFGPRPNVAPVENEGTSDWVDRGIQDVPVADLPQPEGVTADNFDHHITHEDTLNATKQYQEMRPLIDKGYVGDDFAARDRANGLDYEHGQQRIYDLFHGNNPVHVAKDGNQYDIIDGRHRIFVAKELGLETIPARVKERVSD